MIKIIIADDHQIVLDGLVSLIKIDDGIEIVGKAINGKKVLDLLKINTVDIAVLDIEMPEMDGIETAILIKEQFPEIKVLILTMYNEIGFIRKIIQAGVNGYILKNKGKEELVKAIHSINEGEDYFGEEVTKTLVSSMRVKDVIGEIRLTKKEIEVLKLIANGDTTPIIATKLFIANSTVETHRRNLIEKTGVNGSKGLIKFAIEKGYT
jgi:two-component system, NarL family, nitrate/nitrite response regulator NarL